MEIAKRVMWLIWTNKPVCVIKKVELRFDTEPTDAINFATWTCSFRQCLLRLFQVCPKTFLSLVSFSSGVFISFRKNLV